MADKFIDQRGGGSYKPLRYRFCESCGFRYMEGQFCTEDNPESPHYTHQVCYDCYDGPQPVLPRAGDNESYVEPDELWQ